MACWRAWVSIQSYRNATSPSLPRPLNALPSSLLLLMISLLFYTPTNFHPPSTPCINTVPPLALPSTSQEPPCSPPCTIASSTSLLPSSGITCLYFFRDHLPLFLPNCLMLLPSCFHCHVNCILKGMMPSLQVQFQLSVFAPSPCFPTPAY